MNRNVTFSAREGLLKKQLPKREKVKRKVIAPYRGNGVPKDWIEEGDEKYRLTLTRQFFAKNGHLIFRSLSISF